MVTGDGTAHTERLDDYAASIARSRRFEAEVFGDSTIARDAATAGTYPDPVDHCRVCTWYPVCGSTARGRPPSIVAGMSCRDRAPDRGRRRPAARHPAARAQGREGQSADLTRREQARVRSPARILTSCLRAHRTRP